MVEKSGVYFDNKQNTFIYLYFVLVFFVVPVHSLAAKVTREKNFYKRFLKNAGQRQKLKKHGQSIYDSMLCYWPNARDDEKDKVKDLQIHMYGYKSRDL